MFYPSSLLLLTLSLFASSSLSAPTFRKVAISDSNSNSNDTAYPNLGPIDTNSTSPVSVPFNDCLIPAGGTPSAGVVHSVDIFPCERAGLDEPCRLRYGGNYTLTVNFTTYLNSNSPKHTLLARDDTVVPSLKYPYSGQSFNACEVRFSSLLSLFRKLTLPYGSISIAQSLREFLLYTLTNSTLYFQCVPYLLFVSPMPQLPLTSSVSASRSTTCRST